MIKLYIKVYISIFSVQLFPLVCVCLCAYWMNVCLFSRKHMAPFGVKVLCIEPGFFKTTITDFNIVENNLHRLWDKLPQEVKDEYGSDYVDKSELKPASNQTKSITHTHSLRVMTWIFIIVRPDILSRSTFFFPWI